MLSSILIYSLASSLVPKGMLRCVDKLMANFLWNAQGERRAHLVRWSTVCLPMDEGGLDIRGFVQVRSILHAKLLWYVMEGKSLWAKYARAKYFRGMQPSNTSNASPMWNSIVSHHDRLRENSRWVIGEGSINFLSDNWIAMKLFLCLKDYSY